MTAPEKLTLPETRPSARQPDRTRATRIAVIGAGISGLSAALRLSQDHEVTLYEAASVPGGHTNTVDVTLDGCTHPVDTGFLVYNHRTYPELVRLFEELQVPTTPSEMSFSVSLGPHRFEWCGSSLSSVFAQPANAVSPRFWRMLADIVRFNREAGALAVESQAGAVATLDEPLGAWLRRRRYSDAFRDAYLLPMAAAIWSCPMKTMLGFPLGSFVRFFHNHGLLQVQDRPQWYTVLGGGREYVRRIVARLDDVRTGTPVTRVTRDGAGVQVQSAAGTERFDHAVFATHSPQTLAILADADAEERALLGSVTYQPNRAWLHTDTALMPRRRSAWAAWNYLGNGDPAAPEVSVTYWLNRLQPLPFATDVLVSLNPLSEPAPERTIAVFDYEHPVFDRAAVAAQKRLGAIQGRRGTWFAGAWTGYGFHEDGLRSGLDVAARIGAAGAARLAAA